MVDALRETSRVLVPRGTLLDLRPRAETRPLELITPGGDVRAGEIDATSFDVDDAAADSALRDAVCAGWFAHTGTRQVVVRFYWKSIQDLKSYIEGGRHPKHVRPAWNELERTFHDARASSLAAATTLTLGVYRRSETTS
jgi:hypothetical protein